MHTKLRKRGGFTLAEVLITLGVIGVVAAVTMPTLMTNIQERIRKEQVRTVKYKLTKATDKMNSLGKIKQYDTTMDFVNELKKHMTITKICKNNELEKCWPSSEINAYSGSGTTLTEYNPKDLTTGQALKALALSTKSTQTVGIVTGDGVPMLMVYSPSAHCNDFDEAKTYTWSVEDGKPVTNATTNCISAIFDINGSKGPNKIGQDVRTLNSLFGSTDLGVVSITKNKCESIKSKYSIKECGADPDYWAGGAKECADIGLHLPDMATLANIANSIYGITQINAYTTYIGKTHEASTSGNCKNWIKLHWGEFIINESDSILCNVDISKDGNSSLNIDESSLTSSVSGPYWSNSEYSSSGAYARDFYDSSSGWGRDGARSKSTVKSLCVGD